MSRWMLIALSASVVVGAGAERTNAQGVQSVAPEQIKWSQHPALPAGALRAVVYGDPTKSGPYVTRLRSPQGLRVMPHTHPEARVYTVLSGTLYMGYGKTFDESKLQAYPRGSVIYLPAKLSHFQFARADGYEIQINAIGPTDLTFITPSDDLRHH